MTITGILGEDSGLQLVFGVVAVIAGEVEWVYRIIITDLLMNISEFCSVED
jgi:hypothetical protein